MKKVKIKEVAMSDYNFIYNFYTWLVLKLLPNFFFMARLEGLRFTSEKIYSNFSHSLKKMFSKLNFNLLTVTKERCGWKILKYGTERGSYV